MAADRGRRGGRLIDADQGRHRQRRRRRPERPGALGGAGDRLGRADDAGRRHDHRRAGARALLPRSGAADDVRERPRHERWFPGLDRRAPRREPEWRYVFELVAAEERGSPTRRRAGRQLPDHRRHELAQSRHTVSHRLRSAGHRLAGHAGPTTDAEHCRRCGRRGGERAADPGRASGGDADPGGPRARRSRFDASATRTGRGYTSSVPTGRRSS